MKKTITSLAVMLLIHVAVIAQNTTYCIIKYSYDASGNRIKREYVCDVVDSLDPNAPVQPPAGSARMANPNDANSSNVAFEVFPNPTTGMVTVVQKGAVTNATLQVINETGATVYSKTLSNKEEPVDLSKFSTGVYYFVLRSTQTTTTKKVIKE